MKRMFFSTHKHKHSSTKIFKLASGNHPPNKNWSGLAPLDRPVSVGGSDYRRYMKMFSIYCRRLEIVMPPLGVFSGRWRAEELDFWDKKDLGVCCFGGVYHAKIIMKTPPFRRICLELSPGIFTANRSVWLGGVVHPFKSNMASRENHLICLIGDTSTRSWFFCPAVLRGILFCYSLLELYYFLF